MNVKSAGLIQRLSTGLAPILVACVLVACSKKEAPPPPPPEVQVAEVVQKDVPIYIELVGATLGSEDVEIRARVEGYLISINFIEGTFVRKGQLLYRIDPQPFEAALAEAKANLATAHAGLDYQNKLARFLENHDEPRAAATFSSEVHAAAAVITFLSPGLRFFHRDNSRLERSGFHRIWCEGRKSRSMSG